MTEDSCFGCGRNTKKSSGATPLCGVCRRGMQTMIDRAVHQSFMVAGGGGLVHPPYDIDCERAMLGVIFAAGEPRVMPEEIAAFIATPEFSAIEPEDFYHVLHACVFKHAKAALAQGVLPTPKWIAERIEADGDGWASQLGPTIERLYLYETPVLPRLDLAVRLRHLAKLRRTITRLQDVCRRIAVDTPTIDDVVAELIAVADCMEEADAE